MAEKIGKARCWGTITEIMEDTVIESCTLGYKQVYKCQVKPWHRVGKRVTFFAGKDWTAVAVREFP